MGGGRPSNTLLCLTLRDKANCFETITIVTNELIGTDPKKLPPTLTRLMAGQWKKARFLKMGPQGRKRIVEHLEQLLAIM